MSTPFFFDDALLLRVPSLPFRAPPATLTDLITNVLPDAFFQEAVYLASPSLHRALLACLTGTEANADKNRRTLLSALNYHTRMTTRCTPFGLFAGCSVAHWASGALAAAPIVVTSARRTVVLDVRCLQRLTAYIGSLPAIRQRLTYRANSSAYDVGDEVRYVETVDANGSATYQVSAIESSDYLRHVLALSRDGCPYPQLLTGLAALEVSADEAAAFIDDLIDCQMLVSDLSPTVTGDDPLSQLQVRIATLYADTADPLLPPIGAVLADAQTRLIALREGDANTIGLYRHLADALSVLPVPVSENNLTHTDRFYALQPATLPDTWQTELLQAFTLLNRLTVRTENAQLSEFKNRFLARYDQQEIPLLTALDAETGVGYGSAQAYSGASSLIAGLTETDAPTAPAPADWCCNPNFWLRKLQIAQQTQAYGIVLTDEDLIALPPADTDDLPPSLSVIFRIVTDPDGIRRVMPDGYGGSSSVNLLSRFGGGDTAIRDVMGRLATGEERANPDVLFAEVIHLPPEPVANVLRHPPVRAYEIPYLTGSSLPLAQQIPVQDLLVSVKNGRIQLRSARLNRLIIPRLSNAHNYQHKALPLYGFLADVQQQGLRTRLAFSWGRLAAGHSFLPRVTYGNCVISPATWAVYADELAALSVAGALPSETAIRALCAGRSLPRYTLLVDGDHELLTDWESPPSVAGLLSAIRQERVMLREFWPEQAGRAVVQNAAGEPLIHQFVGSLVKKAATYAYCAQAGKHGSQTVAQPTVQRLFPVGSEWLYVKLYAGSQTTDRLLTDVVQPLTSALLTDGLIDNWFFIRYTDPESHLRVRLHLTDPQRTGLVLEAIRRCTERLVGEGIIQQVVYETYVRELERYGPVAIHDSELLFGCDSGAVLDLLRYVPAEAREPVRWLWTMRAIDQLLDAFDLTLFDKHTLLTTFHDAFSREFAVSLPLKKKMDGQYRRYRSLVDEWLAGPDEPDPLAPWPDLGQSLGERYDRLRQLSAVLSAQPDPLIPLPTRLGHYVHLFVHRAIASDQRFHELLLYDFMSRHYRSRLARPLQTRS